MNSNGEDHESKSEDLSKEEAERELDKLDEMTHQEITSFENHVTATRITCDVKTSEGAKYLSKKMQEDPIVVLHKAVGLYLRLFEDGVLDKIDRIKNMYPNRNIPGLVSDLLSDGIQKKFDEKFDYNKSTRFHDTM